MEDDSSGDGGGRESTPTRQEEIAWAAGLFEGEGCWNAYYRNGGRSKISVQARLAMTDEDVVDKFANILGFGTIRRNARTFRPNEKPVTEWYTQKRSNVRVMIELFRPYLGSRRLARADELYALGETSPKNERTHCPKGHPYEGDNLILEPIYRAGKKYFARRCKVCRTEQSRANARKRLGVTPDRYRV